jgi:hypothetical protein
MRPLRQQPEHMFSQHYIKQVRLRRLGHAAHEQVTSLWPDQSGAIPHELLLVCDVFYNFGNAY